MSNISGPTRLFDGKRAVITGGNRGIGFGIAQALAADGAEVCLIARDQQALAQAKTDIEKLGGVCHVVTADLSIVGNVKSASDQLLAISSHWDLLINNAGNPPGPSLLEMKADFWDTTFGVHCRAPFLLAQALVPAMIDNGGGKILNISSISSERALRDHGAYCPAKAALNMLTKVMAVEWGQYNIQINAISPTVVLTKLGQKVWGERPAQGAWAKAKIPAARFAEVDDVVKLAIYLLGPNSNFINGSIIPCDGGLLAGFSDGPPPA